MVNSGDIINYQSDIWLSQEYILRHTGVSYDYLRVAKVRAKQEDSNSWQHTQLMNRCYFSYSKLPRTAANRLESPAELLSIATQVHDEVTNIVTAAVNIRYKIFTQDLPADVAKSAAIIHEAHGYCKLNGISYAKSRFFEDLAREVELQGLKYLPKTWRNLRDKVQAYSEGTPINKLVSIKNEGNQNRTMFANNEMIKAWLIELADSQKNYSYAYIFRKIRTMCEQYSIDNVPSQRWVSDFLTKSTTQYLVQQRYGANSRFNARYRGYTPTQSALFAGDCWDLDATRVNIIDHKALITDKDGKRVNKQKSLYIVAVRDVMSGNELGREYCYEESAQAIINALAMAVANAGYVPYEIRYDRFPGHNTIEWADVANGLQQMGVIMTQTIKAEGKAHIERWWGTLQSVFMMASDYYYGEGIRSSRRSAHRSKEYLASMRQKTMREGFSFDDAARETDKILNAYATTPYSFYSRKYRTIDQSPEQLHQESDKPNTIPVADYQHAYLFGLRKEVSIRGNMITTQIDNATFYYGIDDVEIIERYTGVKLTNCFDFENLDRVHLYDGSTYLGSFDRITPAQQYGPNKDMRAVGKMEAISEKVKMHRETKMNDIRKRRNAMEYAEQEDDEPMSVSSEFGALLSGRIRKHDYEASETAVLHEQYDEDDEIRVDVSRQL